MFGRCAIAVVALTLSGSGCSSGDDDGDDGGVGADAASSTSEVDDDCITDSAPGDHTFTCDGIDFLVMIPDSCPSDGCGLIFDIHGATMSGAQMRLNTELDTLATPEGFIVVHPSHPSNSWTEGDYPAVRDFMQRATNLLDVDPERVHVTGFSQGGIMTWWFVCNHSDILASAAPVAAVPSCIDAEGLTPEMDLLYMQGLTDGAFAYEDAEIMRDELVDNLSMEDERVLDGDDSWEHRRWTNAAGTDFDFIWHNYGGQAVLGGHCIPGGTDTEGIPPLNSLNATTCTTGDIAIHWGELVLAWFIEHPR